LNRLKSLGENLGIIEKHLMDQWVKDDGPLDKNQGSFYIRALKPSG